MKIYFKNSNGILYQGHVLDVLKQLPDECVDCVITSPPYWCLRRYPNADTIWDGKSDCKHEWEGEFCKKCGAWKGQLGLEPTLGLYLIHLVQIMKELKRVLKKTGVIFWNHGDNYSNSTVRCGAPEKCMCLQNFRFITHCIDELGLILRNIIIWCKPNAMPCSVTDRLALMYEPIFVLVKDRAYWFDLDAVRVPYAPSGIQRRKYPLSKFGGDPQNPTGRFGKGVKKGSEAVLLPEIPNPLGKNPGDVWIIATQPFPEAHFATFPPQLIEPLVELGCPRWICKKCKQPRSRIVKTYYEPGKRYSNEKTLTEEAKKQGQNPGPQGMKYGRANAIRYTVGWTKCGCDAGWESGVVLDPFMGSGTVAVVATRLLRRWIGIEISEEYCQMTVNRLKQQVSPLLTFLAGWSTSHDEPAII